VAVLKARPYRMVVPSSYDGSTAVPFIVLLHGYSASGELQDAYFQMSQLADAKGFLLATPDGLIDIAGQRYWNATDYCCGTLGTQKTDDVAYLTAIMNDVRLKYRVDEKRVFFVGHSNGGFMSHRMACDHADRIAAIVSLAGAQWKDATLCRPDARVSVLEVHGDLDLVITYAGTTEYPGAVETVTDWAQLDACEAAGAMSSAGANLDVDSVLFGDETVRTRFDGCPAGIGVELWRIEGGAHVPTLTETFGPDFYEWLMAHPKP
jgi:polyhydroxybutyrate depolymerase